MNVGVGTDDNERDETTPVNYAGIRDPDTGKTIWVPATPLTMQPEPRVNGLTLATIALIVALFLVLVVYACTSGPAIVGAGGG